MRSSVLLVWALGLKFIFVCAAKRSRGVKNKRQLNQRFFEIRRSCENNTPSVDAASAAAAAAAAAATMNHRQADPSTGQLQSAHPMQQPKQYPDGCSHLMFEESAGRITACISPGCHDKIYGSNPLEEGEIDLIRLAQFELCAKKDLKESARMERIEKRKASSAGYI